MNEAPPLHLSKAVNPSNAGWNSSKVSVVVVLVIVKYVLPKSKYEISTHPEYIQ